LSTELRLRGYPSVHLDGEALRDITGNRDYSGEGRITNVRAGQKLAAVLAAQGLIVIASFVSPHRALREEFKQGGNVVEIYLHTDAGRGKEQFFAGAYEPPLSNFIDIDTTHLSVRDCIERILKLSPAAGQKMK
jgi:adenylylsulfate kinase